MIGLLGWQARTNVFLHRVAKRAYEIIIMILMRIIMLIECARLRPCCSRQPTLFKHPPTHLPPPHVRDDHHDLDENHDVDDMCTFTCSVFDPAAKTSLRRNRPPTSGYGLQPSTTHFAAEARYCPP